MQRSIRLVRLPGTGRTTVTINQGTTTWFDLIQAERLHDRELIAQGVGVPAADYGKVIPDGVTDVFATQPVKGN
jgi:hypothetical protein